MFNTKKLFEIAKAKQKTIVFPEVSFSDRTFEAVLFLKKKGIVKPLLVGDASALILRDKRFGQFDIVNPVTFPDREELVKTLYEKRKEKGMTPAQADKLEKDPYYFGTLLVECGYADGMVSGAEASTATAIRPALQIIKAKSKKDQISSSFLLFGKNDFLKDKILFLSDCGLIENPDADTLCQIAINCTNFAKMFGQTPRVAFLSYSTHGSAKGENVDKVKTAFEKFKKKEKDVVCDGELQFDAAMVPSVAKNKCEKSALVGDSNVLIFPNIEAGNICYKAMQYIGGLTAVGPILNGLRKPVNDLSRGCTSHDIALVSAITALQCEDKQKDKDEKEKK